MKDFKLKMELVPSSSWYSNVRSNVSKYNWDIIRYKVYEEYDHKCGICGYKPPVGVKGTIHCHEIWKYQANDNIKGVQTLKGFIALCWLCHGIKHIGHTQIIAREGKLNLDDYKKHFLKVNKCSMEDYDSHYKESMFDYTEKSAIEWDLNIDLLDKYGVKVLTHKQNKLNF